MLYLLNLIYLKASHYTILNPFAVKGNINMCLSRVDFFFRIIVFSGGTEGAEIFLKCPKYIFGRNKIIFMS